ncbi:ABC-2 type transport system ATP-binding protein [Eubacterium aggregans]|uniref:ABC-2 type transport system ATP-binding protein n=1 Tax=Eubacterium aggregans TaxID=81409 RepID=A0A1H4D5N2_9FIRM|nr:ABC transporter ATP-binding protein [Eubacterium aggregans]SEA68143.1 ABC-2 type transport system ATP-binding protein [Eubacterium aggregans]
MNDNLLSCIGLTKRFGNQTALDDLTLNIGKGRIVGLLGPNGSGKTTLIKLATGLLTPTEGTILIGGEVPSVETKAQVSYLPERTYFHESMTVPQIITFFSDFYQDFEAARAMEMVKDLGIDMTAALKNMSKGTKEKVQLIMVMSRRAKLYLLDEPIGGVDPAARDYILNTIIGNYNSEATVVISTHLIADVEKVLDEVIFIRNGNFVLQESVDDIREKRGCSVDTLFREEFRC